MKKLLVIAACLAAFSSLKAETNMSASVGYDSKYIFRGVELDDGRLLLFLKGGRPD